MACLPAPDTYRDPQPDGSAAPRTTRIVLLLKFSACSTKLPADESLRRAASPSGDPPLPGSTPMTRGYASVTLQKDQPVLRRRPRRRRADAETVARLQKDFWKHFDLEKFAMDWRGGL